MLVVEGLMAGRIAEVEGFEEVGSCVSISISVTDGVCGLEVVSSVFWGSEACKYCLGYEACKMRRWLGRIEVRATGNLRNVLP